MNRRIVPFPMPGGVAAVRGGVRHHDASGRPRRDRHRAVHLDIEIASGRPAVGTIAP